MYSFHSDNDNNVNKKNIHIQFFSFIKKATEPQPLNSSDIVFGFVSVLFHHDGW